MSTSRSTYQQIIKPWRRWSIFWSKWGIYIILFLCFILFIFAGFLLAKANADTEQLKQYFRDFNLNMGSELIGLVLGFLFFTYIYSSIRDIRETLRIRQHQMLPYEQYLAWMNQARERIWLLQTYTLLFNISEHRRKFKEAIMKQLSRNDDLEIHLLFAHPDSAALESRAVLLAKDKTVDAALTDLRRAVYESLRHIQCDLWADEKIKGRIKVRIYERPTSMALHISDDKGFFGVYQPNKPLSDGEHLEFPMNSTLGQYLEEQFKERWDNRSGYDDTKPLNEYEELMYEMIVSLTGNFDEPFSNKENQTSFYFVKYDNKYYITYTYRFSEHDTKRENPSDLVYINDFFKNEDHQNKGGLLANIGKNVYHITDCKRIEKTSDEYGKILFEGMYLKYPPKQEKYKQQDKEVQKVDEGLSVLQVMLSMVQDISGKEY